MAGIIDPRLVLDQIYRAGIEALEESFGPRDTLLRRIRFAQQRTRLHRQVYSDALNARWTVPGR